MRRTLIDSDDAGRIVNGTDDNDRIVGRSAAEAEADLGANVREVFNGNGGSDVFVGRGGDDIFNLDGGDRIIATGDDGSVARVNGFDDGNNRINFRRFEDADDFGDVDIQQGSNGALVSVDGSQVFELAGIDADDLSEDDFIFRNNNNNNNAAAAPEVRNNNNDNNNNNNNVAEAPGNLNTDITASGGGNFRGTDGDDLIDANDFSGGIQRISAGFGEDTIITPTNANADPVIQVALGSFGIDRSGNDPSDDDGAFFADDEDADTIVVNSTGGEVQIFDFNAGDNGDDRIDLSNTGITSFDQLNISEVNNNTIIQANNLQRINVRGDADGQNINNQADDFNEDDFIFADG